MKLSQKENLLRAIRHDSPQWVPNGMESLWLIGPPIVERPAHGGKDAFGVVWALDNESEGSTYPEHNGHPVTDLRKWQSQATFPDPAKLDWSAAKAEAASIDRDQFLVGGFVEMGIFERSYLLLGMEGALTNYLTEPETMQQLAGDIANYKIKLIERFDDSVDLDIVWYGDDWGTQDALFMPPGTWRDIIKPATQRIYDCMKERDIIINQHSCGKIEDVFADMVEMGADVWNPCQPCNDLTMLKRKYGDKIAFCGGIDSQFILDKPGITAAEVRAEVRRRIDEMADGGGYIAGPSHSVPFDQELIDAMNDEIATYGRYD